MGGLAGLIQFEGPAPDPRIVDAMAVALERRGPDGHGAFAEGPIAVKHRLRRVRTVQAVQPCLHGDLVVMLDGWIYGHDEVGEALGAPAGLPDTEVLARAWAAWGPGALDRLEGEYAFAVWDRARGRILLARDRLGTRPLYWSQRGGHLAFASSVRALLEVPWVSRAPDLQRIAEYLSFQVVHAPRTLLEGVEQVEPGCIVEAEAGFTKARRYWHPPYAPPGTPRPHEAEVVERLRPVIRSAVERRITSSTGLYLSGGLGSAAIGAALQAQHRALPSFAVAFADDRFPETPFAGRAAKLLGLPLTEISVGGHALSASFDEAVRVLDHPVGHPAVLMQLALARAASEHVRVVLSGNGGESLLGGRQLEGLSRDLTLASIVTRLPSSLIAPLGPWLRQTEAGRRVATDPARYALELGLGGADLFSTEERARLLRDPALVRPGVRQEVLGSWYADLDTDPINLVLHGHLRSILGERALPRADRTAAAAGLDIRFPLLDTAVVELAASLPGSAKVRRIGSPASSRWPLRQLLAGVLPDALLDRPKRSVPAPRGTWLAGSGRLFFEHRLHALKEDPHGLWNPGALEALKQDVARSNAAGNRLWTLFILDAWLRGL